MAGGSRLRAWGVALSGFMVVLAALTACAGPYQYYEGTGIHDAVAAEVAGGWENVEGTRMVLRDDGTALFEKLDGHGFDFEDGWRLSGTGTWQLADDDGGQVLRLALTARTRVESRSPTTATDTSTPEPPSTYVWSFYVDRDQHDELKLFFFYGDPDIGNTYVMTRETGVWETRAQARQDVFRWIAEHYNRERLHSTIAYITPYQARVRCHQRLDLAA